MLKAFVIRTLRRCAPRPEWTYPLGRAGQLGNQLFQIAGTYSLARAHDRDVLFRDTWPYRPYFNVPADWFAPRRITVRCGSATPYATSIVPEWREYFQDVSLWEGREHEVRAICSPSERALAEATALQPEIAAMPRKTAVHVRRGDYVNSTSHRVAPLAYYEQALPEARTEDPGAELVVFSDDIAWCRRQAIFAGAAFADGNPDWADLALMTLCTSHVCANSTFSWWGAYLSDDPRPIALWQPGVLHDTFRSIFPPHWRLIEMAPEPDSPAESYRISHVSLELTSD